MDDTLEQVEDLASRLQTEAPAVYKKFSEVLDKAADAVAFSEALNTLFQENQMISKNQPTDLAQLENIVDSLFLELFAATFFLSTLGKAGEVENALLDIAVGLGGDNNVPIQIAKGYTQLAGRVQATREAREKLAK